MIRVVEGGAGDVTGMMTIMHDAFDPRFGEAWTAAQCLSSLVMPDCQLLLAKDGDAICGFAMSRWVLDHQELLIYQKHGFTSIGRRKNYYKNAEGTSPDAITMLLEL
jgi:ribosomal-protein-alanine N-acetyltransferase